MKSYNGLFEECNSDAVLDLAIKNASKGKKRKRRRDVKEALKDVESFKIKVRERLADYKNDEHEPKVIYDGISRKKRTILVPTFIELVVQHAMCIVMERIFMKGMYEHSYASIPNRGATLGKKHIEKFIRKNRNIRYYLKLDVKKYFESIPHEKLKDKLVKVIRDKRFLKVLFTIIDVVPKGIPIGFYLSQWLANFYLMNFDHWLKEELKVPAYYRYMDDMVIFSDNKRELHKMREAIMKKLSEDGLELKANWQVVKFNYQKKDGKEIGRDLDFMGYRFYRNRTTIRKSILMKSRRKANRISRKTKATIYDCRQMTSYIGYYKSTTTKGYWMRYIEPKVNIGKMRRYISTYDRRRNNDEVA